MPCLLRKEYMKAIFELSLTRSFCQVKGLRVSAKFLGTAFAKALNSEK